MANTVVLRLAGPMQSWGRELRSGGGGGRRPGGSHPSKSGVVGLVANALGRERSDDVSHLASLAFAVRADRPGVPETDFHTAGGGSMPRLDGESWDGSTYGAACAVKTDRRGLLTCKQLPNPVMSVDSYLADASFTAALTGEDTLVETAARALQEPARVLHLGRVAYLPSQPVFRALTSDAEPLAALSVIERDERAVPGPLQAWTDAAAGELVRDAPVNFRARRIAMRAESRVLVDPPAHA